MISPCHMITAHHVIANRSVDIPNGKEVGFFYGQSKTDEKAFLGKAKAKVVFDNPALDFTIVKIDSLIGKNLISLWKDI